MISHIWGRWRIGERLDVQPDVPHKPAANDLSVTDCVTSPVDFFLATNTIFVDQASSGWLTVSRLLGGSSRVTEYRNGFALSPPKERSRGWRGRPGRRPGRPGTPLWTCRGCHRTWPWTSRISGKPWHRHKRYRWPAWEHATRQVTLTSSTCWKHFTVKNDHHGNYKY